MACRSIKLQRVKAVFRQIHMIHQALMRVKNRVPDDKKTSVVYEIPCWDCEHVYMGEVSKDLILIIVLQFMLVHEHEHHIDWDQAKVHGGY